MALTAYEKALAKMREVCDKLPGVTEKASHGSPSWFTSGKQFASIGDNHHGDGRLALWLAAPPGAQAMLIEQNADAYFVPAYVGSRGWVGVRLDRGLSWSEVAAVVEQAHAVRYKPPRVRASKAR